MRLLFVCPRWPGIEEAYNAGREPNGMPGFFAVVHALVKRGYLVDLFIYTPKDISFAENRISKDHWFSAVRIVDVMRIGDYSGIKRILFEVQFAHQLSRRVDRLLERTHYDFVYGQGNLADGARIAARRHGIPFGLRKYGDDFAPLLRDKGVLGASIRAPAAALTYMTRKTFILGTNDGTEIDRICSRMKRRHPYDVYVWNNGFNEQTGEDDKYSVLTVNPFIFQFSRIYRVKGQADTLRAFKRAREMGFRGHCIIAGTEDDKVYAAELRQMIQAYRLEDSVHLIGKVTAEQICFLTRRAVANLITGVNYNLNNVLIESMGYGGIVIVRDTPKIRDIVRQGENGFIFSTVDECAKIIAKLGKEEHDTEMIRENAVRTCREKFGPWEDRAEREVELICHYVTMDQREEGT